MFSAHYQVDLLIANAAFFVDDSWVPLDTNAIFNLFACIGLAIALFAVLAAVAQVWPPAVPPA